MWRKGSRFLLCRHSAYNAFLFVSCCIHSQYPDIYSVFDSFQSTFFAVPLQHLSFNTALNSLSLNATFWDILLDHDTPQVPQSKSKGLSMVPRSKRTAPGAQTHRLSSLLPFPHPSLRILLLDIADWSAGEHALCIPSSDPGSGAMITRILLIDNRIDYAEPYREDSALRSPRHAYVGPVSAHSLPVLQSAGSQPICFTTSFFLILARTLPLPL